jgi:hypothetical protein
MTAVMEPPTEEATDLDGERDKPWEATRPGVLDRLCG